MRIGLDLAGGAQGTVATLQAARNSLELGINTVPIGPVELIQEFRDQGVFCIETGPLIKQEGMRFRVGDPFRVGVKALVSGEIQGLVSAGNTQAMISSTLKLVPDGSVLKGPILPQGIPEFEWDEEKGVVAAKHVTTIADIGANVDASAEALVLNTVLGAAYRQALNPEATGLARAGLISVGEEEYKGSKATQEAFQILKRLDGKLIHLERMAEGGDLLSSNFDVIGGDAATLNPIVKFAEKAVEKFLLTFRSANNLDERDKSANVKQAMTDLFLILLGETTSAALFLGLEHNVIKAHGNSDAAKLTDALKFAAHVIPLEIQKQTLSALNSVDLS
jgi:glycerol-3-phosphate acyltransferase PlsX